MTNVILNGKPDAENPHVVSALPNGKMHFVAFAVLVLLSASVSRTRAEETAPVFTNGTFIGASNNQGYNWEDKANWTDGVRAGGPGSTVTFASANTLSLPPKFYASDTAFPDITFGHLLLPAENTTASICVSPCAGKTYDSVEKEYTHERTRHLILDSGAEGTPATIRVLPPSSVSLATRPQIAVDLLLKSDLDVSFESGIANNGNGREPTAMAFRRSIAESGGSHGVSVTLAKSNYRVGLYGHNTFTGPLEAKRGTIKAERDGGVLGGEGDQFGSGNDVIATNGWGAIDVGGFSFATNQHLYLAGDGPGSNGVLVAGQQSPAYVADWRGPVTLKGTARIGKGVADKCDFGGTIRISGAIGDGGNGFGLVKTSPNVLILSGANTYSGTTEILNGWIKPLGASPFGTGKVKHNGGGLILDGTFDPSDSWASDTGDIYLRVDEGARAVLNKELPKSFTKAGLGTLVLTKKGSISNSTLAGGVLELDHGVHEETGYIMASAWYLHCYGGTIVRAKGGEKAFSEGVLAIRPSGDFAAVRVQLEGAAGSNFRVASWRDECRLNDIGAGKTLDLKAAEGTKIYAAAKSIRSDLTTATPRVTFNEGRAYVGLSSDVVGASPDMQETWSTETPAFMDVTAANAATMPAGAQVYALRFNDPQITTLTVPAGGLALGLGAILVTPESGTDAANGEIVIAGGTLTSTNREIVVHQWNTNRTLRITSQLVNCEGKSVQLTKSGPGRLVLDPGNVKNEHSGSVGVIGGILEVVGQNGMGITNRTLFVGGGATLRAKGKVASGYFNGQNAYFYFDAGGATIDTPEPTDSFSLNTWGRCSSQARFRKTGKGTLYLELNWTRTLDNPLVCGNKEKDWYFEEGVVDATLPKCDITTITGNELGYVHASGGVLLRGRAIFLTGYACNDSSSSQSAHGGYILDLGEGGASVDLNGSTGDLSGCLGSHYFDWREGDFIIGSGTLTITNTSSTSATLGLGGSRQTLFSGTLAFAKGCMGSSPGQFDQATLKTEEDTVYAYWQDTFWWPMRFGALSGSGELKAIGAWEKPAQDKAVLIGRDRDETLDVDVRLHGTNTQNSVQHTPRIGFTKVGSNTLRFRNAKNTFTGAFTVRRGTALATGATLGTGKLVVGEDATDAGAASLLTDGAVTLANAKIRFGATAYPVTIGGNSATEASEFTGAMALSRDVNLHSAGGDVTFSGRVTGTGAITKTGPGKVTLSNAQNDALNVAAVTDGELVLSGAASLVGTCVVTDDTLLDGSKLTAAGDLAIASEAILDLTGVDFDALTENRYVLAECGGTRTGQFASVLGLPSKWAIRYGPHGIYLVRALGFSIILR